jgi:hypothetical protein
MFCSRRGRTNVPPTCSGSSRAGELGVTVRQNFIAVSNRRIVLQTINTINMTEHGLSVSMDYHSLPSIALYGNFICDGKHATFAESGALFASSGEKRGRTPTGKWVATDKWVIGHPAKCSEQLAGKMLQHPPVIGSKTPAGAVAVRPDE